MNPSQRGAAAFTLAVIGVLSLVRGFAAGYQRAQDLLIVHVSSHYEWSEVQMGWVIGGVLALGAAAIVWRGSGER